MKRILLIAGAAVLTLLTVWTLAWHVMANRLTARVESWAEARRAEGLVAEHRGVAVSGFPFRWRVTVTRPTLAGAGAAGWVWTGDTLEAALKPAAMRDIAIRFLGEHMLSAGEGSLAGAWRLSARRPDGRIRLHPDGRLDRLELDFGEVDLVRLPTADPLRVERLTALAVLPRVEVADHRTETFTLSLALDRLSPVRPPIGALGSTIGAVGLDLAVKGRLPPGRFENALAAWRDDGGTVEIARVALRWGPIEADGNGTLTLDAQNRPLGAFTARWRGYAETIDALQAAGQIPPWPAAGAKMALNALARQQADGSRQVEIPLTAQDGRVYVAGLPLMRLAPLKLD